MPEQDHRHAAIMFTDIVGYTALMGSDEDKAFEVLRKNQEIHTKQISRFNGTLIKEMGDGMLISFHLASEAVRCAIEIQKACKEQDIPLKIGIHEGEMVFAGADVLGNSVNIASRLQEDTDEGGINISSSVYKDVKSKADIHTRIVGEKLFKNVDEPVKIYKVLLEGEEQKPIDKEPKKGSRKYLYYILAGLVVAFMAILIWNYIPEKNGDYNYDIAVMYIENLTDNEKFGVQLVNLIHTNLSQDTSLKMVSRQQIYDAMQQISGESRNPDAQQATEVAQRVGARTMLSGRVLQEGGSVITLLELTDMSTGKIISTAKAEGQITGIFSLADRVSSEIADQSNYKREFDVAQITTVNYEAYQVYYEGVEDIWNWNWAGAREKLKKAIELDSSFALAHMYYAISIDPMVLFGNLNANIGASLEIIQKANTLSFRLPERDKLLLKATDALYNGNLRLAGEYLERLYDLDPHSKIAVWWMCILAFIGDADDARLYESEISDYLRRNPHDGFTLNMYAHYLALNGQLDQGISLINRYIQLEPNNINTYDSGWEINITAGKEDEAFGHLDSMEIISPVRGGFEKRYHFLMTNQPDKSFELYDYYKDSISYLRLQELGPNSLLLKGQLNSASIEIDKIINKYASQDPILPFYLGLEKGIILIAAGEYDMAIKVLKSITDLPEEIPLSQFHSFIFQSYYYQGIGNIRSGNYDMARSNLEQLKIMINENMVDWRFNYVLSLLEAEFLLVETKYFELDEKLSTMNKIATGCSPHYMSLLHRLNWRKGEYQEALDILIPFYKNALRSFSGYGGNITYYCWELAFSDYHIGRIYEDAGNNKEAIKYYQIFLNNFSESDPGIPEKEDAILRIDELRLVTSN